MLYSTTKYLNVIVCLGITTFLNNLSNHLILLETLTLTISRSNFQL